VLVLDVPPKLAGSQSIETTTLTPRKRFLSSLADSLEVFKGNAMVGAFGFGHKDLRHND